MSIPPLSMRGEEGEWALHTAVSKLTCLSLGTHASSVARSPDLVAMEGVHGASPPRTPIIESIWVIEDCSWRRTHVTPSAEQLFGTQLAREASSQPSSHNNASVSGCA